MTQSNASRPASASRLPGTAHAPAAGAGGAARAPAAGAGGAARNPAARAARAAAARTARAVRAAADAAARPALPPGAPALWFYPPCPAGVLHSAHEAVPVTDAETAARVVLAVRQKIERVPRGAQHEERIAEIVVEFCGRRIEVGDACVGRFALHTKRRPEYQEKVNAERAALAELRARCALIERGDPDGAPLYNASRLGVTFVSKESLLAMDAAARQRHLQPFLDDCRATITAKTRALEDGCGIYEWRGGARALLVLCGVDTRRLKSLLSLKARVINEFFSYFDFSDMGDREFLEDCATAMPAVQELAAAKARSPSTVVIHGNMRDASREAAELYDNIQSVHKCPGAALWIQLTLCPRGGISKGHNVACMKREIAARRNALLAPT
jgi:hypothetical protein